ncbi:AAA family ATPase [Methylocella sp.]|uniref:AAA family ATPase n=1 Tax=Methylocella sp. TaxID=1978226 RepID=UPI0037843800
MASSSKSLTKTTLRYVRLSPTQTELWRRIVTVLLQEIDDWPSTSLLIAATNHGELLDPAVWRRFDDVLEFRAPTPTSEWRRCSVFLATRLNH